MNLSRALAPALVANIVVWLIYAAQDDRGFPWPIFVTLASLGGLLAIARRPSTVGADGRQRDRSARADRRTARR